MDEERKHYWYSGCARGVVTRVGGGGGVGGPPFVQGAPDAHNTHISMTGFGLISSWQGDERDDKAAASPPPPLFLLG